MKKVTKQELLEALVAIVDSDGGVRSIEEARALLGRVEGAKAPAAPIEEDARDIIRPVSREWFRGLAVPVLKCLGGALRPRIAHEVRVAYATMLLLSAAGWRAGRVEQDEGVVETEGDLARALEAVYEVEGAWVSFSGPNGSGSIRLIAGNGSDVLSDWTPADDSPFDKAISAIGSVDWNALV